MIYTEEDIALLPEAAKRELIRGFRARKEFAIHKQRELARALEHEAPVHHVDGIGRKVMTIAPELAAEIRASEGDWRVLHDPDFHKSLLRRMPWLSANCTPRALTVRVDGLRKGPADALEQKASRDFSTSVEMTGRQTEASVGHAAEGDPSRPSPYAQGARSGHETAGASLGLS